MLSYLPCAIGLAILFFFELLYFKIADHFNIIDKPNHRSSHSQVTIRGGGIIFLVAGILFFLTTDFQYPYFVIGLLLIGVISFADDILTLNNKVRLLIHLVAVLLMFFQWQLFSLPWYWIVLALIFVIGTINAYNFMDGINGITGAYSLITLGCLWYINRNVVSFVHEDLLVISILSLLVFNFFNFRKKAKCFAGDVGSVSISFIIIFAIGALVVETHNFGYILMLLIYGLDAATTIFFRRIRRENIFEAHRSHLYQYLSNEMKWPHLIVSSIYALAQLLITLLLISIIEQPIAIVSLFFGALIVFLAIRLVLEGPKKLFMRHAKN